MPKKSLCLVEVSGKEYLIGLGSDTITLLSSSETDDSTTLSDKGSETTHAI
jgi:flagellar biogenesis protein FliO